jgi:hypothetical protein
MCIKKFFAATCLSILIASIGILGIQGNIASANSPNTSLPEDNTTITLLLQRIEELKQQIQQIVQLIAQLKPLETCGNGICRFGETAAKCPADCAKLQCTHDLNKETCAKSGGQWGCVPGLGGCGCSCPPTAEQRAACDKSCQNVSAININSQDCGANKNRFVLASGNTFCCCQKSTLLCAAENQMAVNSQQCCTGLTATVDNTISNSTGVALFKCTKNACGNGACETGETAVNCATDCATVTCAAEGMIFTGDTRQCCAGLEKALSSGQQACQIGAVCPYNPNYTCQRLQTKTTTPACSQTCKNKGYSGSYCNTFGGGEPAYGNSINSACAGGWNNAGETSDCNSNNIIDAGLTCCCGGTIYPTCGNGACETGETAGNCATDCGKTCQQQCLGAGAGYTGGICRAWTKDSTARGCFSGETSNGNGAKDCNMFALRDGYYKACCCVGSNNLPSISVTK